MFGGPVRPRRILTQAQRKDPTAGSLETETPVYSCATREIEQMRRPELADKIDREVVEDVTDWDAVDHAKREIEIRPAIALGVG